MTLLINKRLSASDKMAHMGKWKKGGAKRLETARAVQTLINRLRTGPACWGLCLRQGGMPVLCARRLKLQCL